MSENIKVLLKFMSIAKIIMLRLFEIPFVTMLLEGFKCEETVLGDGFDISFISCTEFLHYLLIVFSTVLLGSFYAFLCLQHYLYTSYRLTSPLPWAGFDHTFTLARSLLKLILVCAFVFGHNLSLSGAFVSFHLCSLLVSLYVLCRRLTSEVHFKPVIHYTAVTLDMILATLLLTVSVHLLTQGTLDVSTLCTSLLLALIISILFLYL